MDPKFKAFLIAGLRRISYRWPARYLTMNAARVERGRYICNICKSIFARKEICMDHIRPVVDPKIGFVDWNSYIEGMFPDQTGWQVLCKGCHTIKTKQESQLRKEVRAANKPPKESKRKKK